MSMLPQSTDPIAFASFAEKTHNKMRMIFWILGGLGFLLAMLLVAIIAGATQGEKLKVAMERVHAQKGVMRISKDDTIGCL
jgi:hypothetical protein